MLYHPSEQASDSLYQATLSEFAIIKIYGEDSFDFLQNQLSQDMRLVTAEHAQLATFSSAKGRVSANFLIWQDSGQEVPTYYAYIRQDIAQVTQKRLSMFVLRAKVKIELLEAKVCGIWSSNLELLKQHLELSSSVPSEAINTQTFVVNKKEQHFFIQFPSQADNIRVLAISLAAETPLCAECEKANEDYWYAQDIALGLPWITEATKELFVAQSINQDVLHAINFTKGCYPGQEVIARSHYRGSLKRRSVSGTVSPAISDPKRLIASDVMQGEDIVGQVVNAVNLNDNTYLMFEIQLEALSHSTEQALSLAMQEATIHLLPQTYSLDKPE